MSALQRALSASLLVAGVGAFAIGQRRQQDDERPEREMETITIHEA